MYDITVKALLVVILFSIVVDPLVTSTSHRTLSRMD